MPNENIYQSKAAALQALPQWIRDKRNVNQAVVANPNFSHNHKFLGELVRARRNSIGISLRQVAKLCGISAPYLSDLELGNKPWPAARLNAVSHMLDYAERRANESA